MTVGFYMCLYNFYTILNGGFSSIPARGEVYMMQLSDWCFKLQSVLTDTPNFWRNKTEIMG